jgi:hypothetical protein
MNKECFVATNNAFKDSLELAISLALWGFDVLGKFLLIEKCGEKKSGLWFPTAAYTKNGAAKNHWENKQNE